MKSILRNIFWVVLLFSVHADGQVITTILGDGTAGYSGNGPVNTALLHGPSTVKFDNSGNMYIVDNLNNVVRKIGSSGLITTIAGNGTPGYNGDGGQATNAELNGPTDITFDVNDNLYISQGNGVIRKVTTSGIISTIAGIGSSGYSGDGLPATSAQLDDPFGLVFDNSGNLYFSDNANWRIRKINTSGIISTVAGNGIPGFSGDGLPATSAQIRWGGFLAFGPSGDLYIADYFNYRIRKLDAAGIITTVIGTGTNANTGDGGPATAAMISEMWAILFDKPGNMYLTDFLGNYIRKVDTLGIITTIAGTGTAGYSGDGGQATDAQMDFQAHCSAIDNLGNLYIADFTNNRIRRITYDSIGLKVNDVNKTPQNITIYPNPAHDNITINTGEKIQSAAIMNLIGASFTEVTAAKTGAREVTLNIADLPNGMYFVKVNGVYAGRFVKE